MKTKPHVSFVGVFFDPNRKGNRQWKAQYPRGQTFHFVGWFRTAEAAAAAYDGYLNVKNIDGKRNY
jgi:hypothetical protein